MKNKEIGIYIHIPFCKKKCNYCDFVSYCNKTDLIEKYVKAILKEIELQQINSEITTIYIGGGTPSFIDSSYIVQIINQIKKKGNIENAEITIEVNPGTVTKEKLETYRKCGINRLSIGLQTTNDQLLKQIGRIHNFQEFLETYEMARSVGFANINVDLMLGLPKQRIQDLKDSLETVIKINPEHISVYSLIVEENTPIAKQLDEGKIELPDEDTERNMYWYVKNTLELNGYAHYEISNFSKKGFESKHNMNCWNQKEYIGFGCAAHSYKDITRYSNTENLEEYIENIETNHLERNRIINEIQNEEDRKKEYMLLNLRKIDGVRISEFKNKYRDNPIYLYRKELDKLVKENLIIVNEDQIKLTNKGLDLANIVWEEFI